MTIPSPEDQLQFLTNLQRLLSEGAFVATYKYALVLSLADLALERGDDSNEQLTIPTTAIAEKFVQYYSRQCRPYQGRVVLKQNTDRQAEIIGLVNNAMASAQGSLVGLMRDRKKWPRLVSAVNGVVKKMPLWRLQTVGRAKLEFLYANTGQGDSVTLHPGVSFCLRKFYPLIGDLVRGAWVRYVRRFNGNVFGTEADLYEFLFGSERSNLQAVVPVLEDIQRGECFYCRRAVKSRESHVDHFVPWSRYPLNLGHNLVLAHSSCNSAKSDFLAGQVHLERWIEHVKTHGHALQSGFGSAGILCDFDATLRIANWAYGLSFTSGGLTWIRAREYEPLKVGWDVPLRQRLSLIGVVTEASHFTAPALA